MPPPARKPDPQTDYQDPIDRLYRRRPGRPREKGEKPDKTPSAAAGLAIGFGIAGLVPVVGLVFAPLAVLMGFIGLANTKLPTVSGRERAKSGLWFGAIGMVINYLLLLGFCVWSGILTRGFR